MYSPNRFISQSPGRGSRAGRSGNRRVMQIAILGLVLPLLAACGADATHGSDLADAIAAPETPTMTAPRKSAASAQSSQRLAAQARALAFADSGAPAERPEMDVAAMAMRANPQTMARNEASSLVGPGDARPMSPDEVMARLKLLSIASRAKGAAAPDQKPAGFDGDRSASSSREAAIEPDAETNASTRGPAMSPDEIMRRLRELTANTSGRLGPPREKDEPAKRASVDSSLGKIALRAATPSALPSNSQAQGANLSNTSVFGALPASPPKPNVHANATSYGLALEAMRHSPAGSIGLAPDTRAEVGSL